MNNDEKCNNVGKPSAEDCDCSNCQSGNGSSASSCSGWFLIEEFAAGEDVFTAYAPHNQGGFQFSAVCNRDGRILCMMSLEDMTDKVTHARKQFDAPEMPPEGSD